MDMPQEHRISAIEALDDQARGDIPIRDDDVTGIPVRRNLRLGEVVAISGIQAGQRVTGHSFGQLVGQLADRPARS